MSHTPGPWEWIKDTFHGGYSGLIAPGASYASDVPVILPNHCNDGDSGDAWFEDYPSEADRNLIAGAPDLLAACEMALKVGISYPLDTPSRIDSHTEQILRAAIAKAKGETQ